MSNTMRTAMNVEWTLVVLFVLLKLTGIITWSWWWLVVLFCLYPLTIIAFVLMAILSVIVVLSIVELWRFLYKMFSGK